MVEFLAKAAIFLGSSAIISSVTTPVCDKVLGTYSPEKEDFKQQAVVRAVVSVGNIVTSAVIASAATTAIFEEPEAIIEVASEFIQ